VSCFEVAEAHVVVVRFASVKVKTVVSKNIFKNGEVALSLILILPFLP